MGVTAFLSMWINNTAATSIMIPAAVAIIDELRTHHEEAQRLTSFLNDGTRRRSKEIVPEESTGRATQSLEGRTKCIVRSYVRYGWDRCTTEHRFSDR